MLSSSIYFLPKKSALIITDMQNAFLNEKGLIPILNARKIIQKIIEFLNYAEEVNIAVIWTRVSHDNNILGFYRKLFPDHYSKNGKPIFTYNSWHYEIIKELSNYVKKDSIIIDKDRYSAFYQTNLELILRQRGITSLFFTGVATNVCVESSLRDAFDRDFETILVSDCTGTFSDEIKNASINSLKIAFGHILTLGEIKKKFSLT